MIYFELFLEFFKIGLFSLGGGLSTLPFLNKLIETKGWYTTAELTNMLAIAESTPGPVGINMSTYVGYNTSGIFGAIVSTFALILPSYIIITLLCKVLAKFSKNKYVQNSFKIINSVVTALLLVTTFNIFKTSILNTGFSFIKIFLLILILFFVIKLKKHPIFYIILGGIFGIILKIR